MYTYNTLKVYFISKSYEKALKEEKYATTFCLSLFFVSLLLLYYPLLFVLYRLIQGQKRRSVPTVVENNTRCVHPFFNLPSTFFYSFI